MTRRAAVIFDFGGVLLRTEDYEPRHAWDRRLGLAPGTVESIVHGIDAWRQAQLGQISSEQYWAAVGERLGIDARETDALRREFYTGDRLDASLIGLIKELRRESILIGLLSNNSLEVLDQMAALKIRSLFDHCVISAEIGVMKPDAAAYQAILAQLNLGPEYAIFIDDSPANAAGAQAFGMVSILFSPQLQIESIIKKWLSSRLGTP